VESEKVFVGERGPLTARGVRALCEQRRHRDKAAPAPTKKPTTAFTFVLLDRAEDQRFFNCSMNARRSST
jgi:hypothetical protein